MTRTNEQGFAMIVALFMVLALSVLGSSLMFVARTETMSSHNYRLMSQARYGAESGLHQTANYLLFTYTPPPDPKTQYDIYASPVTLLGEKEPIVLSSDPSKSNYPDAAVIDAFAKAAQGSLNVKDGTVDFTTTATLMSMRKFSDEIAGKDVTVQSWLLVGTGSLGNSAVPAQVEVSTILETQPMPVYAFAAFATYDGCGALNFTGGATTDSYDSKEDLVNGPGKPPTIDEKKNGGNVGTNGNLDGNGSTTIIHGAMSTPRKGVGACSANAVTAATLQGANVVADGLTQLSQPLKFPDPEPVTAPTGSMDFTNKGDCPGGVNYCTPHAEDKVNKIPAYVEIKPPTKDTTVTLADVRIGAGGKLILSAGTYIVNSLDMNSQAQLEIDSTNGPVIIKVAGEGVTNPIVINGNGLANPSYVPGNLKIIYGGNKEIKLNGGNATSAVFYAPNASATINGNADIYGALVVHDLKESGGASIHYDRQLAKNSMSKGSPTLSAFNWSSF